MIELQISDAVADISMLQCSAQFQIMFIIAHFVADNASHALASSATAKPTFYVEEKVVVIRNGWTPEMKKWGPLCCYYVLGLFFYDTKGCHRRTDPKVIGVAPRGVS